MRTVIIKLALLLSFQLVITAGENAKPVEEGYLINDVEVFPDDKNKSLIIYSGAKVTLSGSARSQNRRATFTNDRITARITLTNDNISSKPVKSNEEKGDDKESSDLDDIILGRQMIYSDLESKSMMATILEDAYIPVKILETKDGFVKIQYEANMVTLVGWTSSKNMDKASKYKMGNIPLEVSFHLKRLCARNNLLLKKIYPSRSFLNYEVFAPNDNGEGVACYYEITDNGQVLIDKKKVYRRGYAPKNIAQGTSKRGNRSASIPKTKYDELSRLFVEHEVMRAEIVEINKLLELLCKSYEITVVINDADTGTVKPAKIMESFAKTTPNKKIYSYSHDESRKNTPGSFVDPQWVASQATDNRSAPPQQSGNYWTTIRCSLCNGKGYNGYAYIGGNKIPKTCNQCGGSGELKHWVK